MAPTEPNPPLTLEGYPLVQPGDRKPPAGSPNVVAIILDDTGFAHLGSFGSDIATPHMDRLANGGLRYNRFHVTSLCSPTRAAFLTGRNHHAVGMGFLADIPMAYPGYTARIAKSAGTLARILRDAGYSTLAVGKWHLTPRFQRSAAGPFDRWPLGLGFERYYGFLQGDTNHWAPNLVRDNQHVDPPLGPAPGYHLSEDLSATARRYVLDQQQAAPGKPFFLYFALGAMHAPHHVAPEWVAPYRGRFDQGWDAWRQEIFDRQVALGVVPEGTILTERPSWVAAWRDLPAEQQRMHARQQEVFAGFLTHADAQIGALLDQLEVLGQLDNTIVLLFSDNGASAEGGQFGSVNEHRFTAPMRESLADNLAAMDDWGGPRVYNHYSWAWAWAGNTPHRLWKRYTWLGGTRTPLIVHWPAGIKARGEVRSQFAHAIDLAPTVLDALGLEWPASVDGVAQQPVDGASLLGTFDDASSTAGRKTQYFEMLGSRSIYHEGWKATTDHISAGVPDEEELAIGPRDFALDHWGLFDLTVDFSESTDLAAAYPSKVHELEAVWFAEAQRNQVLPVDDSFLKRVGALVPPAFPVGGPRREFLPGAGPVADESVPFLFAGFTITAEVTVPPTGAEGVLLAIGDWNGGFALVVVDGHLVFTFSRAGELLEVVAGEAVPVGEQVLGVKGETTLLAGSFTLLHGDRPVGHLEYDGTLPFAMQHGGAALRLGHDAGLPVTARYTPPFAWTGELRRVVFTVPVVPLAPIGDEIRTALHSD